MGNKLWLLVSFVVVLVSYYYTHQYPEYNWVIFILIATSIIFGVCFEKNRERQGGVQQEEPPPLSKTPEEFKMEQFPIR